MALYSTIMWSRLSVQWRLACCQQHHQPRPQHLVSIIIYWYRNVTIYGNFIAVHVYQLILVPCGNAHWVFPLTKLITMETFWILRDFCFVYFNINVYYVVFQRNTKSKNQGLESLLFPFCRSSVFNRSLHH